MIPDHLSYSSLSTYRECPRAYYLSRVKQAWPVPAWYFIVGSTVHDMIQEKLRTGLDLPPAQLEERFMELVREAMQTEPDTGKWLYGGSDTEPVIEERALKLAQDCYENAVTFLQDVDVWHVEYDASGYLPGCSMEIKAFIDLIGEHKKHGPLIADWKTGKNKPKDNLQLETYHKLYCLKVEKVQPMKGMYVMLNPAASKARPVDFLHTPESLGKMYGEVEAQINKRVARPNPRFMCKFCDQLPNCTTKSGKTQRSVYYDTPEKDEWMPF